MKKEKDVSSEPILPPNWGGLESKRIACLFNADVKEFIRDLEQYGGSYIDKRFWTSRFWLALRSKFQ